jgi:hypothetical protein
LVVVRVWLRFLEGVQVWLESLEAELVWLRSLEEVVAAQRFSVVEVSKWQVVLPLTLLVLVLVETALGR